MKLKIFIIIVTSLAIIIFSTFSCGSFEANSEKQDKIDNLIVRVNEYNKYRADFLDLGNKYGIDIDDLIEKFNNETDNLDKKETYAELIAEKYREWYEEFSNIRVPDFLMDSYSYQLEYFSKSELQFKNFAEVIQYKQYDKESDFDELGSEANIALTKSIKELEIITQKFNK